MRQFQEATSWRLVLWPAGITLVVTVLRLTGELAQWTPVLFNRAVGGGAALIGIIWLVPIFGYYFGRRLAALELRPLSLGRALAADVLALAVLAAFLGVGFSLPVASPLQFLAIGAGSWIAILIASRGWSALVSALVRYGLLARIPVALVVLLGILGDWKTHYDKPPPGLPVMGTLGRWIATGLIPQLTLWMAVTVVVGSLFGALALAVAGGRQPLPRPTQA
jgi:hypothetical protein